MQRGVKLELVEDHAVNLDMLCRGIGEQFSPLTAAIQSSESSPVDANMDISVAQNVTFHLPLRLTVLHFVPYQRVG